MAEPDDSFEEKALALRWLYRRRPPWEAVRAEYTRLFPGERDKLELAHILKSAWIEARELAGWTYDVTVQAYFRPDGSKVIDDDGSEWSHL